MKKIFFFLFFLFLPMTTSAGAIKNLEVTNGTLSRVFESDNNIYSIVLGKGEEKANFKYVLEEENAKVEIEENQEEKKTILHVQKENGMKEDYTFYLESDDVTPVFQETSVNQPVKKVKLPHLEIYVGFPCFLIILILFKCVVLGFKRKK